MALYSQYLIVEIFGIIFAITSGLYVYLKYVAFNYWSSRNIDFVKPVIPYGSFSSVMSAKLSLGEFFRDAYLKFKERPVCGVYTLHKPTLVVNEPDLIRLLLTKKFSHFHDRGMYCNEKVDPLAGHLFFLSGSKWKYLRAKLSPTFTSSKMKQMFFTLKECSDALVSCMAKKAEESEFIEFKDVMARFSTDVIASTAFGIQCNSLENPDAEFRTWGQKFFKPRPLLQAFVHMLPAVIRLFKIHAIDVDISNFFISTFKKTVEYRRANNVVRNDFTNLVMQLMDEGYVKTDEGTEPRDYSEDKSRRITMLEGAAQAFIFWLAGFETSSTTSTHCLYELALHQEIQNKVADEINSVLEESGGLTYESLKKMHYLHKVVSETLRKYPPVPFLNRICTEGIELPGTSLTVEKGTAIVIPILGLHSDPDFYPEPERFDPERFNDENIASRHQYAYLPFGEGPRICIGMRFGLIQTKVGLLSLLSKYRLTPGPDLEVPMPIDKQNFVLCFKGGLTLRIEKR